MCKPRRMRLKKDKFQDSLGDVHFFLKLILAQQQAASSVKALILRAFFTSLEQHKSKLLIKCKHLKLL